MVVSNKIVAMAYRVRKNVERWVAATEKSSICYDDLCGACAIASYTLWKLLLQTGYKARFVCASHGGAGCHCWVELGDNVIDVTATQFDLEHPSVYVFTKTDLFMYTTDPAHRSPWYEPRSKYNNQCASANDLKIRYDDAATNMVRHWDDQSPFHYEQQIKEFLRSEQNRTSSTTKEIQISA